MYQDMYQRLSHNLPAVPPPAGSAPSYAPDMSGSSRGAPHFGSLEQVSPPHARTPAQPSFSSSLQMGSRTLAGAPSLGGPGSRTASGRR